MKNKLLELEIEKYVPPGVGLGYIEGKPVFVPETLRGDRVRVAVEQSRNRYQKAQLQEVLTASADRIAPSCLHYSQCGGCDAMHMSYETQLLHKLQVLQETLDQHSLKPEKPVSIIPNSQPQHYRHRTRLHYDGENLGFKARKEHTVFPIPECLILSNSIKNILPQLKNHLKRQTPRNAPSCEVMLQSSTHSPDVAISCKNSSGLIQQLMGFRQKIEEDYGWGTLKLSSSGFAQSTPIMMHLLIQAVLDACEGAEYVGELYCGVGSFSLPLSQQVKELWAYDIDEDSINLAKENAKKWAATPQFKAESANRVSFPQQAETLLVDPPRSGLSKKVVQQLRKKSWKRLIYVSCNPASFSRDLSRLTQNSSIKIQQVTGFDFYSHTTHLEVLAVLER